MSTMARNQDVPDAEVRKELTRLLRASLDFTRAYQAWTIAPEKVRELEAAERRLDEAEHRVSVAQSKHHSK